KRSRRRSRVCARRSAAAAAGKRIAPREAPRQDPGSAGGNAAGPRRSIEDACKQLVERGNVSPRLAKALAAGSVVALFPLLNSWPRAELLGLQRELRIFHRDALIAMDAEYRAKVFRPEVFFNPAAGRALDEQYQRLKMRVVIMCTEMESVIIHLL